MRRGARQPSALEELAQLGALQLAVLEHQGAARVQQRRARCETTAHDIEAVRLRRRARPPDRTAAPPGRAGSRRRGCRAGSTRRRRPCRRVPAAASARSAKTSRRLSAPTSRTFWRAQTNACGEFSTATTCACGTSVARASAIAPLPVPRSTRDGLRAGHGSSSASIASWATNSVSGRGHEHSGSDGELERPERRPTGDVLQRLARGATLDERARP